MHNIFEADDTDAVLLIDASNAFNALNRAAALHNIRVLCPIIAIYAINTYRHPARLFITGGKELESAEGTTQGDPLAMGLYALSLQPLITYLQSITKAKQCWFADDASGAGSIEEIKKWWNALNVTGPDLGYFPNGKKCWLIVKPEKEENARDAFKETAINVTTQGQTHLGAVVGSRSYLDEYVSKKVENWVNEITKLAEFAVSQPQACYAAFTFGLKHRWTYFLRTQPDIQDLLEPLENAISHLLIPSITEHNCSQTERDILALPVRMGGLGFTNPCQEAKQEYTASVNVTTPLVENIISQTNELPDESHTRSLQQTVRREKENTLKDRVDHIKKDSTPKDIKSFRLGYRKGIIDLADSNSS
ncbi:hypothetical protein QZH41_004926 [Actinostola sp. cb2023]|nr:hypothetical protein QZH41_004926 [Actinostola sp. cb2023]